MPGEADLADEEKVLAWTLRCFLELGFSYAAAVRLSEGGADHHAAAALLAANCDHRTCYRILRPLRVSESR